MLLCNGEVLRKQMHQYALGLDLWAAEVEKIFRDEPRTIDAPERKLLQIKASWTRSLSRLHIEKALLEQSDHLAVVPLRSSWWISAILIPMRR